MSALGGWPAAHLLASLALASPTFPDPTVGQNHPPSLWERAADPEWATSERLHRLVQRQMLESVRVDRRGAVMRERMATLRHALEGAGAAASRDVRVRFDLGFVLGRLDDNESAVDVLSGAVARAPDHPLATEAYFVLGTLYAKLGQRSQELAMYVEYLRRETNPARRAQALANRAESEVALGQSRAALADYRASLELVADDPVVHWGFAVALDRTGDPRGAIAEVKAAIAYDPLDQHLNSPAVFFVPAYDRAWYDGLGAMVRAQEIDDPATAVLWWELAVTRWLTYLSEADASDPWLPLAQAHKDACDSALAAARKAAMRATGAKRGRR